MMTKVKNAEKLLSKEFMLITYFHAAMRNIRERPY